MPSGSGARSQSTGVDSAIVSDDSSAETARLNQVRSAKLRRRMQLCSEPVMQRVSCFCCNRNFRKASEKLSEFREHLRMAQINGASNSELNAAGLNLQDFTEKECAVFLNDQFLFRLLARCQCDFPTSLERLLAARAVHRKYSLDSNLVCTKCTREPGYHSFRQVGFDLVGRPVLYTCLNQDLETGVQPEQVRNYLLHLILAIREAEKTIPEDQHTLVIVFDTTGLGMSHICADAVSQFGEMLRYFPARMSYALALNLNRVTRLLLKPIIHLTKHQEDIMMLPSGNLEEQLQECFGRPLASWMTREVKRNAEPHMPFWTAPVVPASTEPNEVHDPRGEQSYIENYIEQKHPSGHQPHPSIASKAKAPS